MRRLSRMQPLSGILVVDFTTLLPGPLATLMLAEAGAEVIKIERPGGEDMRVMPPVRDGEAVVFAMLNRGKKSLVCDLKNENDRKALVPLLRKADVLMEQFRPGVMERLGLGYAAVRQLNPRIVYCSISGYGQQGPRAGEAGHDINYLAATGLLALQPGPIDRPVVPPALVADIGGGTMPAVINILLGLRQRDATGEGVYLDIAMTDAMFTFAWYAYAIGQATGTYPGPGEIRLVGASPRYQLYPTRDGKLVACGALEQKFWVSFCNAIGLPAPLVNDLADPAATKAAIAAIIARETADHWRPKLAAADCCVTIMASLEEAMHDPHFVERGLFAHKVSGASGNAMAALPVPIAAALRGAPGVKPSPKLGADNNLIS
ncbi:MAG: alpha-methylacyl-CoA racemase [Hyphomicrobiales bacterium]|jgi:crotonobetainyl-CoA:carnitine CoA-transferase CaiB-like acyl-CoA transferase